MSRVALLFLLAGCGPRNGAQPEAPPTPPAATPAPPAEPTATPVATGHADGESCLVAADCASGICEGMGCTEDAPGVCKSKARMCTMDLQSWCDCEGETFQASGSCPGRRYASKGACE